MMEYGKEQWLNMLANLRKGELLIDAACGQEQFLRSPQVISPLAKDGYKKLLSHQLPHYQRAGEKLWYREKPQWDSVMVDEITRKIVLFTVFCCPEEIMKSCSSYGAAFQELFAAKAKQYYGVENQQSWLHQYYGIAEKLVLLQELNDSENGCFARGWRVEVFMLNFYDDEGVVAVNKEVWQKYYDQAWNALFPREQDGDVDMFFNTLFPL